LIVCRAGSGEVLVLDCRFDDELDEYPAHYHVYLLPALSDDEIDTRWQDFASVAIRELGDLPVADVEFDATRRRELRAPWLSERMAELRSPG